MPTGRRSLFLLPFILFLFLAGPELVRRSMYTDGVAYATLARNLAEGQGSFWFPQVSTTFHASFHEHPPLVFGIQSLFFRVGGDSLVVERVYAGLIFLLSALLLILLWRESHRERLPVRQLVFVPLTLWLLNEVVYHFYPAHILEPTMSLFCLGAVYLCLRSVRAGQALRTQIAWAACAGLLLVAGTLCKGFVALFPLAFYGLYMLIFRNLPWQRALGLSLVMLGMIGAAYALILLGPDARTSLQTYFDTQVKASVLAERTTFHHRSNRLYIIRRTAEVLIPALLLTGIIYGIGKYKIGAALRQMADKRYVLLFLLLGVAASFPLVISPKQAYYYLLPSMPYFALGLATLIGPYVTHWFQRESTRATRVHLPVAMYALLIGGSVFMLSHVGGSTRRDAPVLHDIDAMRTVVDPHATIAAQGDIAALVSYFARLHHVNIDTTEAARQTLPYLVAPKTDTVVGHRRVDLTTKVYDLYEQ